MRTVDTDLASPVGRGLLGTCDVNGGPTAEQQRVIAALVSGYFGADVDVRAATPLDPAGVAAALADEDETARHRFVEYAITLEFCRHPAHPAQAENVELYASALGIDEELQQLARDSLEGHQERLMSDYERFHESYIEEPELVPSGGENPELVARLETLADCPPGSLGRAFHAFYQRWGLKLPGSPGGGSSHLVPHDFTHVITGYEPIGQGELSLQALIVSATDGGEHFSLLCASLALHEAGTWKSRLGSVTQVGSLARPGAPELFADAIRRGAQCRGDPEAFDHLGLADEPLADVRADLNLLPLTLAQDPSAAS